jgi:hypothetical protein
MRECGAAFLDFHLLNISNRITEYAAEPHLPAPPMNAPSVLGQFGTFDVENYGDLLYPVLFQRLLQQRHDTGELRLYSLMGSDSLHQSGCRTRPVRELFSSRLGQPHALIVGGGDLLRTDWDTVASHYRSEFSQHGGARAKPGWKRWFARNAMEPKDADREFRRQHMDYAAVGPFIIEPDAATLITSVAYCSCGVPFPFDETLKDQVARAFNQSRFIYLRDHASAETLRRAGVTHDIHVAPDLVVALSDFFDAASEREKGRRLLHQLGVDLHRRVLCFQSQSQKPGPHLELLHQLKNYQRRRDCEVVLLPLGWCHGDGEYLQRLARESAGAFHFIDVHSIFDIIAVLAACDVFLGTSLHGNITAFSFGLPHLFGPIEVAKREGFLEVADLRPDLKLQSWAELNQGLELCLELGAAYFAPRAAAAKRRVHEASDLLLRAVNGA